ncbi:hypothetical protein DICA3_B14686 [Diutina catenulata]
MILYPVINEVWKHLPIFSKTSLVEALLNTSDEDVAKYLASLPLAVTLECSVNSHSNSARRQREELRIWDANRVFALFTNIEVSLISYPLGAFEFLQRRLRQLHRDYGDHIDAIVLHFEWRDLAEEPWVEKLCMFLGYRSSNFVDDELERVLNHFNLPQWRGMAFRNRPPLPLGLPGWNHVTTLSLHELSEGMGPVTLPSTLSKLGVTHCDCRFDDFPQMAKLKSVVWTSNKTSLSRLLPSCPVVSDINCDEPHFGGWDHLTATVTALEIWDANSLTLGKFMSLKSLTCLQSPQLYTSIPVEVASQLEALTLLSSEDLADAEPLELAAILKYFPRLTKASFDGMLLTFKDPIRHPKLESLVFSTCEVKSSLFGPIPILDAEFPALHYIQVLGSFMDTPVSTLLPLENWTNLENITLWSCNAGPIFSLSHPRVRRLCVSESGVDAFVLDDCPQLTMLDASQNPLRRSMILNNPRLTSVDIHGYPEIKYLTVTSPGLTTLTIGGCRLNKVVIPSSLQRLKGYGYERLAIVNADLDELPPLQDVTLYHEPVPKINSVTSHVNFWFVPQLKLDFDLPMHLVSLNTHYVGGDFTKLSNLRFLSVLTDETPDMDSVAMPPSLEVVYFSWVNFPRILWSKPARLQLLQIMRSSWSWKQIGGVDNLPSLLQVVAPAPPTDGAEITPPPGCIVGSYT